jgi:hypothetical protein
MRDAIRYRSGLMEGVDIVLLRLRKPVDALELYDWQAPDLVPLNAALNELWTRWDQEGIRRANDLVNKCADLLGASVALTPASTLRQRLRKGGNRGALDAAGAGGIRACPAGHAGCPQAPR